MPAEKVELSGRVVKETVDAGSKSERAAVVLKTDDGQSYLLRRHGAPAFGDRSLDGLVGTSILTKGVKLDQTLIVQEWRIKDE